MVALAGASYFRSIYLVRIRSSFNFRTMCVVGVCAAAGPHGRLLLLMEYQRSSCRIFYTPRSTAHTHSFLPAWPFRSVLFSLCFCCYWFCFYFDKKMSFFFSICKSSAYSTSSSSSVKVYFCTHAIRQTMRNESKRDRHTKEDENCKNEGWPLPFARYCCWSWWWCDCLNIILGRRLFFSGAHFNLKYIFSFFFLLFSFLWPSLSSFDTAWLDLVAWWGGEWVCAVCVFSFIFRGTYQSADIGISISNIQLTSHTYSHPSICDSSLGHENCAEMGRRICTIETMPIYTLNRARGNDDAKQPALLIPHTTIHTPRTRFVQRIILCTRRAHTSEPKKSREGGKEEKNNTRNEIEKCIGKFHVDKWNKFSGHLTSPTLSWPPFARAFQTNSAYIHFCGAATHIQRYGNVYFTHSCFRSVWAGGSAGCRDHCYGRENCGALYLPREK